MRARMVSLFSHTTYRSFVLGVNFHQRSLFVRTAPSLVPSLSVRRGKVYVGDLSGGSNPEGLSDGIYDCQSQVCRTNSRPLQNCIINRGEKLSEQHRQCYHQYFAGNSVKKKKLTVAIRQRKHSQHSHWGRCNRPSNFGLYEVDSHALGLEGLRTLLIGLFSSWNDGVNQLTTLWYCDVILRHDMRTGCTWEQDVALSVGLLSADSSLCSLCQNV